MGDPTDPTVDQGPLASRRRARARSTLCGGGSIGKSILALGGRQPDDLKRGFSVEPTLFTDVEPGMRIEQEEIFRPVLCLIPAKNIEDAVAIANGTQYGLAASVLIRRIMR